MFLNDYTFLIMTRMGDNMIQFNLRKIKKETKINLKKNYFKLLCVSFLSKFFFLDHMTGIYFIYFAFKKILKVVLKTMFLYYGLSLINVDLSKTTKEAIYDKLSILSIFLSIVFILMLFVSSQIHVGKLRIYMYNIYHKQVNWKDLFYTFRSNRYWSVFRISFLFQLRLFLFGICFLVPGIIKSFEYYYVPYILCENPNISYKRAFAISKCMTNGVKTEMFAQYLIYFGCYVLLIMLSLISIVLGWNIIDIVIFCLVLILQNKITALFSQLYAYSRMYVLKNGFATNSELIGF